MVTRVIKNSVNCIYTNKSTGNVISAVRDLSSSEVTSTPGSGDGQYFRVVHKSHTLAPISGENSTHTWSNWIPNILGAPGVAGDSSLGFPSLSYAASRILALTNPSRPDVDLPIAIWELRELPSLVRKFGDTVLEKIADGNLRYQFGIRPLVSDITALLNFTQLVDLRIAELIKLKESGLRRKRDISRGSLTRNTSLTVETVKGTINLDYSAFVVERGKMWAFVEWKPLHNLQKANNQEIRNLARRSVLGLTLDASTVWNALPWSWLIDWFSNIGDILTGNRNIIPCEHGNVQVMRHKISEYLCDSGADDSPPYQRSFSIRIEVKQRDSVNPANISARIPFLTLGQVSILGSLAALRLRG
jgi:hypothetical protein